MRIRTAIVGTVLAVSITGLAGLLLLLVSATPDLPRDGLLAALALAWAGAALALGVALARRLSHALERLARYAESLGEGSREPPPPSRAREIAALGTALAGMRDALENRAYVERLAQDLAHELKSPVTGIRAAAEVLAGDPPAEDRARFLAHVARDADRLGRLAERFLALASVEARPGLAADAGPVPLAAVVRAAVDSVAAAADARGVRLDDAAARATTLACPRGEPEQLADALGQLLRNAVEFSPRGGTVRLRIESAGSPGQAALVVDDAGPGLPPYVRERAFERFVSTPRPDGQPRGSGLGLAFARGVARRHGGDVTLGDAPGGGTRAVFVVPAR